MSAGGGQNIQSTLLVLHLSRWLGTNFRPMQPGEAGNRDWHTPSSLLSLYLSDTSLTKHFATASSSNEMEQALIQLKAPVKTINIEGTDTFAFALAPTPSGMQLPQRQPQAESVLAPHDLSRLGDTRSRSGSPGWRGFSHSPSRDPLGREPSRYSRLSSRESVGRGVSAEGGEVYDPLRGVYRGGQPKPETTPRLVREWRARGAETDTKSRSEHTPTPISDDPLRGGYVVGQLDARRAMWHDAWEGSRSSPSRVEYNHEPQVRLRLDNGLDTGARGEGLSQEDKELLVGQLPLLLDAVKREVRRKTRQAEVYSQWQQNATSSNPVERQQCRSHLARWFGRTYRPSHHPLDNISVQEVLRQYVRQRHPNPMVVPSFLGNELRDLGAGRPKDGSKGLLLRKIERYGQADSESDATEWETDDEGDGDGYAPEDTDDQVMSGLTGLVGRVGLPVTDSGDSLASSRTGSGSLASRLGKKVSVPSDGYSGGVKVGWQTKRKFAKGTSYGKGTYKRAKY